MANNPPQQMPLQGTKDAPKFNGKVPALLPRFLEDVDLLATAAGINDTKKICYAMLYADLDEAEVWQTVSTASAVILDWDDFADQVKELYPVLRRRYPLTTTASYGSSLGRCS